MTPIRDKNTCKALKWGELDAYGPACRLQDGHAGVHDWAVRPGHSRAAQLAARPPGEERRDSPICGVTFTSVGGENGVCFLHPGHRYGHVGDDGSLGLSPGVQAISAAQDNDAALDTIDAHDHTALGELGELEQAAKLLHVERCRRRVVEDANADIQIERNKLRRELSDANGQIAQLKFGNRAPRPGGTFVKRKFFGRNPDGTIHELVGSESLHDPNDDRFMWTWRRTAYTSGMGIRGGRIQIMDSMTFDMLPPEIVAENWWHLCSKVGLTEARARLCYFHPEEGQPSAVEATVGVGE